MFRATVPQDGPHAAGWSEKKHVPVGFVERKSGAIELKQAWEERDMVCFQQARAESGCLTRTTGEANSDAEAFDERDPCSLKAGLESYGQTRGFLSLPKIA